MLKPNFNYEEAFSRNLGWVTEKEQQILDSSLKTVEKCSFLLPLVSFQPYTGFVCGFFAIHVLDSSLKTGEKCVSFYLWSHSNHK